MVRWIPPSTCDPPHAVGRPEQVRRLFLDFLKRGWDIEKGALVGYPLGDRIQLLSGSHRWAAAKMARIRIPVVIRHPEEVWAAWGDLEKWGRLMTWNS